MTVPARRAPLTPSVGAVLLAAGEGKRFASGPKLLATLRCRPLLALAVEPVLEAGLPLVVVSGAVDLTGALEAFGANVAVVENVRWAEGQATSLLAGIAWCRAAGLDAAVVGLGDQPFVPASAWRRVAAATPVSSAPIVTATFAGHRRPPVRLDRSVWPLLSGLGDEGARELMRRRPELVAELACEGDPVDVDTVDSLLALERDGHPARDGPVPRTGSGELAP